MSQLSWKRLGVAAAICIALSGATARAETSFNGPIRLIVPYAPGGGAIDVTARALQRPLQKILGTKVIVENKPGASTKIGTMAVMNAPPDGQTLLVMSAPGWVGYYYSKMLDVRPWEQMVPLAQIAESPYSVVTVKANGRFNSWADVVAWAKAHPDQPIKAGAPAAGGFSQLMFNQILERTGIKGTFIPYAGAGQARAALLGGEIDIQMESGQAFLNIRNGLTKGVAISTPDRFPLQNDIPTFAELKIADTLPANAYSVWGPKGIKPDVVKKLVAALHKATKDQSLIELLQDKNAFLVRFKDGPAISAEVENVDKTWGDKLKTVAP
ncbi:MAG: tripartite tricarboxylate transporter substrate binding protein [Rhizobiales bacterium]|nr:tripartite tricarboxylate transporter substrate binding protein [Hyphomicrobiales bacterium]